VCSDCNQNRKYKARIAYKDLTKDATPAGKCGYRLFNMLTNGPCNKQLADGLLYGRRSRDGLNAAPGVTRTVCSLHNTGHKTERIEFKEFKRLNIQERKALAENVPPHKMDRFKTMLAEQELEEARIEEAKLEEAKLEEAKLEEAKLEEVRILDARAFTCGLLALLSPEKTMIEVLLPAECPPRESLKSCIVCRFCHKTKHDEPVVEMTRAHHSCYTKHATCLFCGKGKDVLPGPMCHFECNEKGAKAWKENTRMYDIRPGLNAAEPVSYKTLVLCGACEFIGEFDSDNQICKRCGAQEAQPENIRPGLTAAEPVAQAAPPPPEQRLEQALLEAAAQQAHTVPDAYEELRAMARRYFNDLLRDESPE
jgi:hypothetical protein